MINNFNEELIKNIQLSDKPKLDIIFQKLISNKKKLMIVGNGGSASIASHFSIDFNNVIKKPCLNFSDSSMLTCFSNDYGYENWISKVIEIYGQKGDILISISSSGESQNIINGINMAKKKGILNISFTGFQNGNTVAKKSDISIWVKSNNYNIVESVHLISLLSIIEKYKNINF